MSGVTPGYCAQSIPKTKILIELSKALNIHQFQSRSLTGINRD